MTPARFRWGSLFILIGAILLLRNLEVITDDFWMELVAWSPLFLIAIGVEKIFTGTKLQLVAYATSFFLFFGGLYLTLNSSLGGQQDGFFTKSSWSLPSDGAVRTLEADLDLGEGNLTIRDASSDLVDATFEELSHKPKIKSEIVDGVAKVSMVSDARRYRSGMLRIDLDTPSDWYLQFSNLVPLLLKLNGQESDIHLNLAATPLRDIQVSAEESDVYLKVGDLEPLVRVKISGENSKIRLRFPSHSGVKITGYDDPEYLNQVGLKATDGVFINSGYDSVGTKVEVELDDRLSSLSIDYY